MRNMDSIIASHNAKVLAPKPAAPIKTCNCHRPQECPLNGMCQTKCIVYKATISAPGKPTMAYYGLTEKEFKLRYTDHTSSFRHSEQRHKTRLSMHMWELKDLGLEPSVEWEIHKRSAPYKCGSRRCDLCLTEKMVIATADPKTTLNKRSELTSTCRHRSKFFCKPPL